MPTAPGPDRHSNGSRGVPLRFLAAVLLLWTCGRIAVAWSLIGWRGSEGEGMRPTSTPYQAREASAEAAQRGESTQNQTPKSVWAARIDRAPVSRQRSVWATRIDHAPVIRIAHKDASNEEPMPEHADAATSISPRVAASDPAPRPSPLPLRAPAKGERRWSAGAWLFWRERGGGATLNSFGQLGASQAGARADRAIGTLKLGTRALPVLGYGRISAALDTPHQSEAAVGVAIRALSGRTPLSIGVERRIALEHSARNAFALVLAGGLNPTPVVGPIAAEGYAQAGVVGLSRRDTFADGRIALTAPLDRSQRVRAGFSVSGGAQPYVARLDIGPVVEARLRLGGIDPRLVVEWRQRVAGNARPGSGLSVTLASDF
ncbi:hypothetical protein OOT33_09615 [Sphingobium sp. DEHP117]|uniref:hypothetical protein n=1 Tax=Sphingobium sp. DEHP117 TaxID=2993436 RepID=UPI0027D5D0F8|nr:hypothetical protein [Sphingobium sp. DEHP117]MDQ4420687.1 hypothetical protein [Sphingobium sp. DEHP117]